MIYSISPEHGTSDYYYICTRINSTCFPHAHSHFELIFVLNGQLSLFVDDAQCLMKSNTVGIIMPYQIHSYQPLENTTTFHIACPPEYIDEFKRLFSGKSFSPFIVSITRAMRAILEEVTLLEEEGRFDRSKVPNSFKSKTLLYAVLSEFLYRCSLIPAMHIEYDIYRQAVVYITEHYTQNISLASVAQHCGITPQHLSRIMNSQSNTGFSNIVNSLRVFEAKRLLEQTTDPISQIALDAGFGTVRSFNRIFRQYFNCHPRELRSHAQSADATPLFELEPRFG